MKIAIAQLNYTVGDISGNATKIADAMAQARVGGASLLLTTELAISGYPPEDLLLRDDFYDACSVALTSLAQQAQGITLVIGHPHRYNDKHYNAASVLRDRRIVTTYLKRKLMYDVFVQALAGEFRGLKEDTTEENLQARIRGTLLMAMSNKTGAIVLTTGNKSEMSTGYATLYGDMAGGFGVLKDINKMLVYRLSNYRNSISPVIPRRVIERPPSAELRPDQKDQDSLPSYEVLDAIIEAYVENDKSPRDIIAAGYPRAAVEQVVRLIRISEYKRRQSPVGIRITARGFGKDWRYPITNKFRPRFE